MTSELYNRTILILSGAIALLAGASLTFAPDIVYASYGVELDVDPSMMSEIRGPAGAFLAVALFLLLSALRAKTIRNGLAVASVLYLGIAGGRVVSYVVDGQPASALVWATVIEIIFGGLAFFSWIRSART